MGDNIGKLDEQKITMYFIYLDKIRKCESIQVNIPGRW